MKIKTAKLKNTFNLKQKLFNPKHRASLSIFIFIIVGLSLSLIYNYFAKGATYGWLQSSWSEGIDTSSTANHTNNQSNWNKFFSKNDNILANTEITLNSTNLTKTDTTTENFQAGTNTNGTYPIINSNNELKLDIPTCETLGATGVIAGTACITQGQNGVTYSIPAVSGAIGYTWNYTGTGFSISTGENTNYITVDFSESATAGNLTVTPYNGCENGITSAGIVLSLFGSTGNSITAIVDVTNPITGKTWMDRNLGASRAAISSTDSLAYGDLYQWGRLADRHQCKTSPINTTLSTTNIPGHSDFITPSSNPVDWRSPQNNNLWQGVSGINNPCPSGYRIPTWAEMYAEELSWITNNAAGAFASPLKFTLGGKRDPNGSISEVGTRGRYWTSSIDAGRPLEAIDLFLSISPPDQAPGQDSNVRATGSLIRCIKD